MQAKNWPDKALAEEFTEMAKAIYTETKVLVLTNASSISAYISVSA